ncbi:MAG: prephenate dehydrogenase [Ruminococcus sp.]|nr:prephenate dehydrogenase [Ruminococcus sp.]
MNIAIVGLGIIGGSYCKALKSYTKHTVTGINRTDAVAQKALNAGAIDRIGTPESLAEQDIIILCMYPQACLDFLRENGKFIRSDAIVTDAAGIKRAICPEMQALAREYGFIFVGSHPMAGKEKNGFDVSDADLFMGASFLITPCGAPSEAVGTLAALARSIGFRTVKITTPEEHDRMIAFTSQLPHVLACAYVLSPSCPNHNGFSAGSYRDVSRVANINAGLWAELFLENREPLVEELDILIDNINRIINAIKDEDKERLYALLEQGHQVKQALGE